MVYRYNNFASSCWPAAFIIFFGAAGIVTVGDGLIGMKVSVVIAGLGVVLLTALAFSYIKMFGKNASVEVLEDRIVLRNYRGRPTEILWTDVKSFWGVKSDAPNLRIRTRFWTDYMVGGTIEDFSKLVEEVEKNSGMPIH